MRRTLRLLPAAVALAAGTVLPPALHAAENQTVHTFSHTQSATTRYEYLLALPTGYAASGEKRWPLLLFLHGSGERGDDVWLVAKHGPPKLLRGNSSDPAAKLLAENFIVVSPQCPKGRWWDTATVLALLDDVGARHRVDARRVYLTGLSMGGYGAWDVGLTQPERFAAIVPICGGGSSRPVLSAETARRKALRSLGVWAFHGAKDESVPLAESQRIVDFLKKVGVEDIQLTVYPEAKHDSWTATYANPELYTWLLRHERPAATAAR
ncbi:carboxylesterase family protein [Horticoccus sp. 23ND18S-11]|uniref:carboxylesterase family protein n=1 Tax=Horticoccus sp. 23ND18S-11 TaxID=3391832 RepID=UPI0039C8E18E